MNRWLWQLETAFVVTLGALAGPLAAQAPSPGEPALAAEAAPPKPDKAPWILGRYAVVPSVPHSSTPVNAPEPPPKVPCGGPVQQWWQRTCDHWTEHAKLNGWYTCCFSTHNDIGCGSFNADMVFIFGTCRQYFGQACMSYPLPGPPVPGLASGPPGPPPGIPFGGPYTGPSGASPYR